MLLLEFDLFSDFDLFVLVRNETLMRMILRPTIVWLIHIFLGLSTELRKFCWLRELGRRKISFRAAFFFETKFFVIFPKNLSTL